jgi:hypothetical protein
MQRKANTTDSARVLPGNKIVLKRNTEKKARVTPQWQISQKPVVEMLHLQIQFVRGGVEKGKEDRRI